MKKTELELWEEYTEIVKKHNAEYSRLFIEKKLNQIEERRKRIKELEEKEAKECNERFRLYNLLPWYIKIFTESPYCTKYFYSNASINLDIDTLIAHRAVLEEFGEKKEISYEKFLTWQITKEI